MSQEFVTQEFLDVSQRVLDRQVVDVNNVECGKVDDLELEGGVGEIKITAILVGTGATSDRLPVLARALVPKIFGQDTIRIPWDQVMTITEQIKLKSEARTFGLDEERSTAFKIISVLPWAWKK